MSDLRVGAGRQQQTRALETTKANGQHQRSAVQLCALGAKRQNTRTQTYSLIHKRKYKYIGAHFIPQPLVSEINAMNMECNGRLIKQMIKIYGIQCPQTRLEPSSMHCTNTANKLQKCLHHTGKHDKFCKKVKRFCHAHSPGRSCRRHPPATFARTQCDHRRRQRTMPWIRTVAVGGVRNGDNETRAAVLQPRLVKHEI